MELQGHDFKAQQFNGYIEKKTESVHTSYIWCMASYQTPDSHYIITAGNDLTLKFWNIQISLQIFVFNSDNI